MTPTEQPPVHTQELKGRYLAEQMVEHPEREDCYIARLLVKEVSPKDSRPYFLDVENAHGTDRYAVKLTVKGKERNQPTRGSCPHQSLSEISCLYIRVRLSSADPVSMASVIGVVIALLLLFVIMVVVLLYAYKKQKMCFKGKKEPVLYLPPRSVVHNACMV